VKVTVVEEQLRTDVVRARVDLGLQKVHLEQSIGGSGVALGKGRDPDAEAA